MKEVLITILFPAVLFFWATPLVARIPFFRRLGWLEKIIFTGASSSSVFIILASWGAVFGDGSVSLLLGSFSLLALALFLYWLLILVRNKPKINIPKFSKTEKLLVVIILAILLKIFVLFILRPIVDPDVVTSYLPYARTIFEENSVPAQDKYTLNPMTIPPIGGPILYATNYVLSGNTFSESFRLFTFPFFVGLVIFSYLIGSKIGGRLFGLVSSLIFLSLPWVDTLLLEWAIYPELFFAFLGLALFYFLEFHFFNVSQNNKMVLGVFFGLVLTASLLLKDQGIFLFFLLPLLILFRVEGRFFSFLAVFFAALPFILLSVSFSGITYFAFTRSPMVNVIFLGAPVIFLGIRRVISERKVKLSEVIKPSFLSFALGSVGTLWILRNITLYTHPVLPFGGQLAGFYENVLKLGIASPAAHFELKEIQLLFLPVFGTLLLLPKILGLLASLFEKKLFQVGFWFFAWYAIVVLYFGQANERYLSIIMPTLVVLTAYGIQVLGNRLQNLSAKRLNNFLPISSILFGFASLTQSIFLSWNLGSGIFPSLAQRKMLFEEPQPVSISRLTVDIQDFVFSLTRVLNTRPGVYSREDVFQLLIIGFIVSLAILLIGWLISSVNLKKYTLLGVIVVFLLTFPYFFVTWNISEGEVLSFAHKERSKVYNSWGLTTHIVPYLKENASEDSKVLVFGPQAGLSYYTGLAVWNLEFGYGLSGLKDVIDKDEEVIAKFMDENKIDYFLLYDDEPSLTKFSKVREKSKFFQILMDERYFEQVVKPNEQNLWILFRLK